MLVRTTPRDRTLGGPTPDDRATRNRDGALLVGEAPPAPVAVSVVIPVRDAADHLADQLEALATQRWCGSWEVVLADNGSRDGSVDVARRFLGRLPHLRVLDASAVRGPGHGRNVAAAAAVGDVLAFVDADDVVGDGWLAAVAEGVARHDFVACRLDYERLNDEGQLRARGVRQPEGLYRMFGDHLPFSGSGTLAIRRALHDEIGGFDEAFVLGGEDPDYCWRVQHLGAKLAYVPGAVVHYRYRSGSRRTFRQARNYGRFRVQLLAKHRAAEPAIAPDQLRRGARAWARLLAQLPALRGRDGLAAWMWQFGLHMGLVEGSLAYGMLLLDGRPAPRPVSIAPTSAPSRAPSQPSPAVGAARAGR